jgi:hypothetical protein
MDLEEARLEGKKLFTDGIKVGEWFDQIESKCGCSKTHILCAVAPFSYVAISQSTMSIHGAQIILSLADKMQEGNCVLIQDRYFFFTDSIDAIVFKLFWQHN